MLFILAFNCLTISTLIVPSRLFTLSLLKNDKSILSDFIGTSFEITSGWKKLAYLVVLMEDYNVVL